MSIRPSASPPQIENILDTVRNKIDKKNFILRQRPENKKTITRLGFLNEHVTDVIYELTHRDYHAGPEQNKSDSGNRKGSIWKFGKLIDGIEVYIKLHVIPFNNDGHCVCISFHESTKPITYPFK